jgi:hypothetical protein
MKFLLLPLLALSLNCTAQDTTYFVSGFSYVYRTNDRAQNTYFDTVNLQGSYLKIERRGDVYYLPSIMGDTLLRIAYNTNYNYDTIHGVCNDVKERVIDTVLISKIESIAFRNGISGFYVSEAYLCPRYGATDKFNIYYPDGTFYIKNRKYKIVSFEILIARKKAAYSN